MGIRWRLVLAVLQFAVLVLASTLATGVPLPPTTWFASGALAVLFALQFSEPFHVRPADALVSSGTVIVLVVTSGFPGWPLAWWVLLAYATLGLLIAILSVAASRPRSQRDPSQLAGRSYKLIRAFSGRVLYSSIFVLSVLVEFDGQLDSTLILLGAWAVLVVSSGIRWDQVLLGRRAKIAGFRAVRLIAPSRLIVEGDAVGFDLGGAVRVSSGVVNRAEAFLVRRTPLNTGLFAYELLFASATNAEKLVGRELRLEAEQSEESAIGVVAPGTSDLALIYDPIGHAGIGAPVMGTSTAGSRVLFQVSGLRVEREIIDGETAQDFVRASAVQVGELKVDGSIALSRDVLEPGSAVTAYIPASEKPSPPTPGSIHVGNIANTGLAVWLDPAVATRGHMAVLGMTGMGKSSFTRRLAVELAKTRPVVVVDQTGEYTSMKLPATNSSNVSVPTLSVRDLAGSAAPHREALAALKNLEALGRKEFMAGDAPMSRVLILEEAHQFVPEPALLGFGVDGRNESIEFGLLMMQVRKFGVSVVLVSQRTSVVAKSALSQCENIVAFKSVDQTGLDYLEAFAGSAARQLLPRLGVGEALTLGPSLSIQAPAVVSLIA